MIWLLRLKIPLLRWLTMTTKWKTKALITSKAALGQYGLPCHIVTLISPPDLGDEAGGGGDGEGEGLLLWQTQVADGPWEAQAPPDTMTMTILIIVLTTKDDEINWKLSLNLKPLGTSSWLCKKRQMRATSSQVREHHHLYIIIIKFGIIIIFTSSSSALPSSALTLPSRASTDIFVLRQDLGSSLRDGGRVRCSRRRGGGGDAATSLRLLKIKSGKLQKYNRRNIMGVPCLFVI